MASKFYSSKLSSNTYRASVKINRTAALATISMSDESSALLIISKVPGSYSFKISNEVGTVIGMALMSLEEYYDEIGGYCNSVPVTLSGVPHSIEVIC